MKKKITAFFLILLVIVISSSIMVLPSFFTKGISRIELKQNLDLGLVLDGVHDIELVFFGYAGCFDICTPRLEILSSWYSSLPEERRKKFTLRFMDISIPDNKSIPDSFAKTFNPDFKGVFLDKNILRVYTKAFNVYFSKALIDETEMDHTAHLYLLNKSKEGKQLRYIYTAYPYDFNQIQSDIEGLDHE